MSLVTNILAVLGIVAIILLVVYLYKKYEDKDAKTSNTPAYPPADYMKEIGSVCPDLWKLDSIDNHGNSVCRNDEKVPTAGRDCEATARFEAITTWPIDNKNLSKTLKSRCDWIEKCGPTSTMPAAWTGIDNLC